MTSQSKHSSSWRRFTFAGSVTALGLAGLALTGCAVDSSGALEGEETAVVAASESALVADSDKLWMPSGNTHNTTIKMCWQSGGDAAGRQAVQDVIAQTWDANSWVNVTWATSCSAGMVPVTVTDSTSAPAGDPSGVRFNFTFANWSPSCQGTGTAAQKEATRIACIKTIAAHEFGHVLAFVHEQNRTNHAGITCNNGTFIAWEGSNWTIVDDWDLTPVDTASMMSYCPEGTWTGMLTANDIAGVRAVYGGEANSIQHDSRVAIREYDKRYWQGNGTLAASFKAIRVRRVPATAGGLKFGDKIRLDFGGKFLCSKAGTANTTEWTTTYVEAKCSWKINQVDAEWDGTTVDVNDPLTISLTLTAAQNGGTAFNKTFPAARFLRAP
jgi:hypothetical protein